MKVGILGEGEKGVCVSVCVCMRVCTPVWIGYKGIFLLCLPFVYINDLVAGLPENFHSA